jgi:peptidoglycan L-alanyl-D-glutamate endopeptidase CwlK
MIPLATAHNITHDKLATLVPSFRARVAAWLDACHAAGLQPYIYEGLRTSKRQTELYAIGRTVNRGKAKLTNAKAGQSMHQYGLAIDFVPLVPAKAKDLWNADWSDKAYAPYHKLALKFGLRRLSWETPHIEDATVADWRAAAKVYPST